MYINSELCVTLYIPYSYRPYCFRTLLLPDLYFSGPTYFQLPAIILNFFYCCSL